MGNSENILELSCHLLLFMHYPSSVPLINIYRILCLNIETDEDKHKCADADGDARLIKQLFKHGKKIQGREGVFIGTEVWHNIRF